MTKRDRVLAACACERTDRVPFSLWYHFRLDPPAGPNMARAELDFYRRYEPDLFKVMHDIPFEMPPDLPAIETAQDWSRLPVMDGVSGNFGLQLATVEQIISERGDDGPVIDTVFSIFSTAQKVCGKRTLEYLSSDSAALHAGLARLADSLSNYARSLLSRGADGIYLAISGAASDTMDSATYREHFLKYDQQILDAASGGKLNVVHHHGQGIYPELILGLRGYHVYSWSDRLAGNPSIREMRLRTSSCLMGGVDEVEFGRVSPEEIAQQAAEAAAQVNGTGIIVAPGCAVPSPPDSPDENLRAIRKGIEARP